jgi:hypothetical protein
LNSFMSSPVYVWFLFKTENLVLPPGCRPYGPEAGPGQR